MTIIPYKILKKLKYIPLIDLPNSPVRGQKSLIPLDKEQVQCLPRCHLTGDEGYRDR